MTRHHENDDRRTWLNRGIATIAILLFAMIGIAHNTAKADTLSLTERARVTECLAATSTPASNEAATPDRLPKKYQRWASTWSGTWGRNLCSTLTIKKVNERGEAIIHYRVNIPGEVSADWPATISEDGQKQVLTITFFQGVIITYTMTVPDDPNETVVRIDGLYRGSTKGSFFKKPE